MVFFYVGGRKLLQSEMAYEASRESKEDNSKDDEELGNAIMTDAGANFQPAAIVGYEMEKVDRLHVHHAHNAQIQAERWEFQAA